MQTARFTQRASSRIALTALLCSCLLSACGNKGPLYLDEDEPATAIGPAQVIETEDRLETVNEEQIDDGLDGGLEGEFDGQFEGGFEDEEDEEDEDDSES